MKEELQAIANCFEEGCREEVFQFLSIRFDAVSLPLNRCPYQVQIKLRAIDQKGSQFPSTLSWENLEAMVHYFQRLYSDRYGYKNDPTFGIPAGFLPELRNGHKKEECELHRNTRKEIAGWEAQAKALKEMISHSAKEMSECENCKD